MLFFFALVDLTSDLLQCESGGLLKKGDCFLNITGPQPNSFLDLTWEHTAHPKA